MYVTPLIEITPRALVVSKGSAFIKIADEIMKNWGHAPIFVDFQHLDPSTQSNAGFHPVTMLGELARVEKLHTIFVSPLRPAPKLREALRAEVGKSRHGICLRLILSDLSSPAVASEIDGLLSWLSIHKEEVDLVIDAQIAQLGVPAPLQLASVPSLTAWRSFTVAAGSLPENLQDFCLGSTLHPRIEWTNWVAVAGDSRCRRKPTFGDFTIQHGLYIEPPDGANPSASIRYTTTAHHLTRIIHERRPVLS